jgi:hypothetical protein
MDDTLMVKALAGIASALSGLLWWLWRTDRTEQNDRIHSMEVRMNDSESDRISREEFNSLASSIRNEFRGEHSKIIEEMRSSNVSIRMELRDGTRAITDRIDRLIEVRVNGIS